MLQWSHWTCFFKQVQEKNIVGGGQVYESIMYKLHWPFQLENINVCKDLVERPDSTLYCLHRSPITHLTWGNFIFVGLLETKFPIANLIYHQDHTLLPNKINWVAATQPIFLRVIQAKNNRSSPSAPTEVRVKTSVKPGYKRWHFAPVHNFRGCRNVSWHGLSSPPPLRLQRPRTTDGSQRSHISNPVCRWTPVAAMLNPTPLGNTAAVR